MSRGRLHGARLHGGWWRLVEAYLIMAFGATLIAIVWSGHYLRYVRPELAFPLILTGASLLALGVWTLVVTCRRPVATEPSGGHDHHHGTMWSVWLIIVPVLVAALISPPAIGAQLAQRRDQAPVPMPERSSGTSTTQPPRVSTGEVEALPMNKYVLRAFIDEEAELAGRRFRVGGFVINQGEQADWYVARIRIRCCAADAVPMKVGIVGELPPYPDDTWVEVTGSYLPVVRESDGPIARLRFEEVREVKAPENPYIFG